MRRLAAGWLTLLLIATPAYAEPQILARCGASTGSAFYFEGGAVGPGQGGWKNDGVQGGRILAVLDGTELDILFSDRSGQFRSHRKEGSQVQLIGFDSGTKTFTIIATNQKAQTVEHFLFRLNELGVGTVAWGTLRGAGLMAKSSLMTAACTPNS